MTFIEYCPPFIYFTLFDASFSVLTLSARIWMRMRDPTGTSPNYIIRVEILALSSPQMAIVNVLAPPTIIQYLPTITIAFLLQFAIVISVCHSGIRNYALNRPLARSLLVFYRTRVARRVAYPINDPYAVML